MDAAIPTCPVLTWGASGAMMLTGRPDAPTWPAGDVIGRLEELGRVVGALAGAMGTGLSVDVAALLVGRAAGRGWRRLGRTSVGRHCRLIPTADSWVAVSLARPDDLGLLPAFSNGTIEWPPGDGRPSGPERRTAPDPGTADVPPEVWGLLEAECRDRATADVVATASELGLPVGGLGLEARPDQVPWRVDRVGDPSVGPVRRPVVVDLSALWAGPVCAHVLGRAGADVIKVADRRRPDTADAVHPEHFEELHRHHRRMTVDFSTDAGRRELAGLVDGADVIIEASRPRAFAGLGLEPERFLRGRPGRSWVTVTGYGRREPGSNRVAFGDDAAVSGGLVAWDADGDPVFCADAVADPVTGLCAATAALASLLRGGGHLIDCSMAASAAFVATDAGCAGTHHLVEVDDDRRRGETGWEVSHDGTLGPVHPPGDAVAFVRAEPVVPAGERTPR